MTQAARLRELLRRDGMVVAPGADDCITARLIQRAGFDALYMTGAVAAAALVAMPDKLDVARGYRGHGAASSPKTVGDPRNSHKAGRSFLRHPGLAQTGEIRGFEQGADLRHPEISGYPEISDGLQPGDA